MTTYQELVTSEYARLYGRNFFKMNEGSGTTINDSKGSGIGTISGATWVSGGGLRFDGIDDIVNTNFKSPNSDISIYFEYQANPNNPPSTQVVYNDCHNGMSVYARGFWLKFNNEGFNFQFNSASNQLLFSHTCRFPEIFNGQKYSLLFTWNKSTGEINFFIDDMDKPKETIYVNFTYDSSLAFNPSIGRARLSSAYYYPLKGILSNFIIFDKDISKIKLNKTLILHNGEYKKYDSAWQTVSMTTPTAIDFLSDGMDSLSPLLDRVDGVSPLDSLSDGYRVVTWTDEFNANRVLDLNVRQSPQLVYPKSDISLLGVESIDSIILTASGNNKIAVSFDSGLSWKAYKNGAWETVTDASEGMTATEINGLTPLQIKEARGDSAFIRFSYYLGDENAEIDKIELKVSMLGIEQVADTDDYKVAYDDISNTIIYNFKKSGTYTINYVT